MRIRFILGFLLMASVASIAQQIPLEPGKKTEPIPEVTFELNWRQADPQYYRISVDSTGDASYRSQPRVEPNDTPGDPYMLRFIVSEPTRTRIFQLVNDLNQFKGGKFETRHNVAQTGVKTLTYRYGQDISGTSLNYSDNPKMNELIGIFQRMSSTFELSRRLEYDLRYDRLGLDRDLKALQDLKKSGQAEEMQVIAPTLERIANDPAVMNIARQRARQLLNSSETGPSSR